MGFNKERRKWEALVKTEKRRGWWGGGERGKTWESTVLRWQSIKENREEEDSINLQFWLYRPLATKFSSPFTSNKIKILVFILFVVLVVILLN